MSRIACAVRSTCLYIIFIWDLSSVPSERLILASTGSQQSSFVFLFIFDLSSTLERKNPLGLIAAFRHAFRRQENATLILKVHPRRTPPRGPLSAQKSSEEGGAIVIDQSLPRGELNGLIAACHCYVSLHRSEGLGLTIAEAMMLGKPSIATAYSGNLDFMDEDNSLLVGYDLVEVESDCRSL